MQVFVLGFFRVISRYTVISIQEIESNGLRERRNSRMNGEAYGQMSECSPGEGGIRALLHGLAPGLAAQRGALAWPGCRRALHTSVEIHTDAVAGLT